MMSLSASVFDLNGHIVFNESAESSIPKTTRRISRTATLDGLSVINDFGQSVSDGTYNIEILNIPKSTAEKLRVMVESYSLINLSTEQGFFSGVIKDIDLQRTPVKITFFVKQKIS